MTKQKERITRDARVRSGQPIVRGTRITVTDILEYLAGGTTPDEILADFPDLTVDELDAVLAFDPKHERP